MPVDPACRALQDRIAVLTDQVENLEPLQTDPELTPSEQTQVGKQIYDIQAQIAVLRSQLAECLSELTVHGVELTQGIQYFSINGQGSGAGADNGIPLIAGRALVLRVYPDAKFRTPGPVSLQLPVSLGGYVRADSVLDTGGFRPIKVITPLNGTIAARPVQAIDHGNPDHSLNFRLDSVDCQGTVRFTVTVFPVGPIISDAIAGTVTGIFASTEVFVQFQPVPDFRLRFVPIHFTGQGMDIPAPPMMTAVDALQYILGTYPIGGFELEDFTPVDFDRALDGDVGCGGGWADLLSLLRCMQAVSSDPAAIFVATIAPEVQTGNTDGCGGTGVAAVRVYPLDPGFSGPTMAQEVGHALGRKHAPVGGAANPDPNFPHYDSYPLGSIGEFGFDIQTSQVYYPATTIDFMGYCPNLDTCIRWISPYTYLGLSQAMIGRFAPPTSSSRAPRTAQAGGDTLFLGFRLSRNDAAELRPSFHLPGATPPGDQSEPSDVTVELRDAEGLLLTARRCHQLAPDHQQDGDDVEFFEPVPWFPQAAAVVVVRGTKPVATVAIESIAPEVVVGSAPTQLGKDATAEITWTTRHPERPVTSLLRYSNDAGRTWRALAANLTQPRYRLDASLLPGGSACLIEVAASAGVRTAVARTPLFSVPVKRRRAHILSPAGDVQVSAGQAVLLRGVGYSPDFGLGSPADVRWTSSIDGPLGRGFELIARGLSAGTHEIRLEVPDGLGGTCHALVTVTVTDPESRPE